MKKSVKIITLALSLALIICAALALSVNAEAKPEIISQNVAYEGNFALMYAVKADTATAPVDLYLYYENPTDASVAAKKYTATTPEDIKIDGELVSCYVFKTEGVSGKDMIDSFYVQAVDATKAKSDVRRYSVGEYFYERLADPTITAAQETLYVKSLEFGAAAQAVLAPTTTPVTSYRYVNITGGTLADGFNTGIFPIGTDIAPVGNSDWKVVSYADDKTATEQNVYRNGSFRLEGITFVTPTVIDTLPEGTLGFEGSTELPSSIGKTIQSSGGSVSIATTERDGKPTNAVKFTSTAGALDVLSLKTTIAAEEYNTVVYDFLANFGASGDYELILRDTAGNQVFRFGVSASGGKWKITDVTNTSVGNNFWSYEFAPINTWVNVKIVITPDSYTKQDKIAIYFDNTPVTMGVKDGKYFTYNNVFLTADKFGQLDLRAATATANDLYVDNLRVERLMTSFYPAGTDTFESTAASADTTNGVVVDEVYGSSSNVYKFAPTKEVTKSLSKNSIVTSSDAQALGFCADVKVVNGGANNANFDFMWDGTIDGSSKAVYWLRFSISDGKLIISNQKDGSKLTVGVKGEYVNIKAAYVVLGEAQSAIYIYANDTLVGSFTTQYNAGSASLEGMGGIRIRSMKTPTEGDAIYFDNLFYGYCYIQQ